MALNIKRFGTRGCRTCKFHRPRTVRNKECLKGWNAVFGFECKDWEGKDEKDDTKNQKKKSE